MDSISGKLFSIKILIIVGSALTSWFGHEMQIAIEENNSKNYVDFPTDFEFVLIDTSNSEKDIILSESVKKIATTQFIEGLTITLNHYFKIIIRLVVKFEKTQY